MTTSPYRVTYQVEHSRGTTVLMLYGPNESEAIAELYRKGAVSRSRNIIILRIEPA